MRLHPTRRLGLAGTAVAVPLALLLAACGSSSSAPSTTAPTTQTSASSTTTTTPASSASFDSCSVVTQAEAASALGQSVTAGVLGHATVEQGLACVFYGSSAPTPRDPSVAQPDSVRVVVVKGADAVTRFANYRASPAVRAQTISGLGDQAYYDGYASLSVLKGDSYLRVAVAPAGAAPSLTREEQLAAAILPRL
jgi:hypothetical protein